MVSEGEKKEATVIEEYSRVKQFWARIVVDIMGRTGSGYDETLAMDIQEFFYILHVTQPKEQEPLKTAK